MLAQQVVEHLELPGFEIDEAERVMRKRPPSDPSDALYGPEIVPGKRPCSLAAPNGRV
jgi:hypothetical protein